MHCNECGNSSVVELHVANVVVASSNLVSRSIFYQATSPSGKARVCKILIPGSNPGVASMIFLPEWWNW